MPSRALAVAAVVVAALLCCAAPASAHASLQDSTPAGGALLDAPPRSVVLRFSERVEVALGGVRVFDQRGQRVDRGQISRSGRGGAVVVLALPRLREGGYIVTWRVVSADSHPVQGAFTFAVGEAPPGGELDVTDLVDTEGSRVVGVAYGVGRTVAFAGLLLLLGGIAFAFLVWPGALREVRPRRALIAALVVSAIASLANLGLQGAYAAGLGLGDAAASEVLQGVLETRFGRVYVARFVLLGLATVLVWVFLRRAVLPAWWKAAAAAVGLALAATPGLAGHAAAGSHQPYALVADVVHFGAAAVWLGGVVMLLLVLDRLGTDVAAVSRRFSQVALYAVGVLVATGLFQSYRQVGSLGVLRSTEFGQLLSVKLLLVAGVLLIAVLSRRVVQRWSDSGASVAALRRTVAVEAAIAVGVLSVTALLVNAVPSKVYAAAPQSGQLTSATLLVDYTISPGRAGRNDVHLYTLSAAGRVQDVAEMSMSLRLADKGVGAVDVPLVKAAPGHFQALAHDIPLAGQWTMVITARTSEIDSVVFEGSVQIK